MKKRKNTNNKDMLMEERRKKTMQINDQEGDPDNTHAPWGG